MRLQAQAFRQQLACTIVDADEHQQSHPSHVAWGDPDNPNHPPSPPSGHDHQLQTCRSCAAVCKNYNVVITFSPRSCADAGVHAQAALLVSGARLTQERPSTAQDCKRAFSDQNVCRMLSCVAILTWRALHHDFITSLYTSTRALPIRSLFHPAYDRQSEASCPSRFPLDDLADSSCSTGERFPRKVAPARRASACTAFELQAAAKTRDT